jgi:hypothetical protein
MPNTELSFIWIFTFNNHNNPIDTVNISTSLGFGEIMEFIQGHVAWKWFGQNLTQVCVTPEFGLFITLISRLK